MAKSTKNVKKTNTTPKKGSVTKKVSASKKTESNKKISSTTNQVEIIEKKDKNNKALLPIIIAILTLLIVAIGATYSYFSIVGTNESQQIVTKANIDEVGSVILSSGNNILLNLTREEMMQENAKAYYASSDGNKTVPTTENIGTAIVTGNGTFNCTYDLKVSATGNLYSRFYNQDPASNRTDGQIVLTINGVDYDFNTANLFPITLNNQSMNNISEGNNGYITASLKLENSGSIIQDAIKDSNIVLKFEATNFNCEIIA